MFLVLAGITFVIFLLARRHWKELNANDLGSMSEQWLAEYNARHA
jgi:hypothetical protein